MKLKEKLKEMKNYEVSMQKLIFAGKILSDANTIESYNITENGFIVVMVSPPKGPQQAAAPPPEEKKEEPKPAAPAAADVKR